MKKNPILVTQPSLPNLKEFTKSLEKIWESKWLTNNGEFHQEFEKKLAEQGTGIVTPRPGYGSL